MNSIGRQTHKQVFLEENQASDGSGSGGARRLGPCLAPATSGGKPMPHEPQESVATVGTLINGCF